MKKYKIFFTKTIIIFILSMIIAPSALILWINYMVGRHHYSQTADYIQYLINTKNAKAAEFDKKGNKIVIFSGSNTLYSLNSKYIYEKTGLPVINYGIHMGLEHYLFHPVKNILKPGDTVIMPLEYSIYKKDNSAIPSQLAEYIVSYGKEYMNKLSPIQKLGLSIYLLKLIAINHKIDAAPLKKSLLCQINDFGDFIDNKGLVSAIHKNNRKYIPISEEIPNSNKNFSLYDFIQYCKTNDIKIYATTPFHYHNKDFSKTEIEAFNNIKNFYNKNGVKFLGNIDSGAIFDENLLYDFGYHANDLGQQYRTEYIIELIRSL